MHQDAGTPNTQSQGLKLLITAAQGERRLRYFICLFYRSQRKEIGPFHAKFDPRPDD